MSNIQAILESGVTTTEQATEAFDQLEAIDCASMLGRWRGSELRTGNAMDGLLEATGWYGKEFVDFDHVHPLLFGSKEKILKLEPRRLFAGMGLAPIANKIPGLISLFKLIRPLIQTRHSRARLRMTEYRGKVTATMQYDHLPINDVFRKVDNNTVLGVMDLKGMPQPYYFVLRRDS
ncbi:MAG: DUF4334 domain-containing protein [Salinisphaeraceae bacterium]|nr:DUF4334 domain-containing protein [Salinisphaeraceae bacterium]